MNRNDPPAKPKIDRIPAAAARLFGYTPDVINPFNVFTFSTAKTGQNGKRDAYFDISETDWLIKKLNSSEHYISIAVKQLLEDTKNYGQFSLTPATFPGTKLEIDSIQARLKKIEVALNTVNDLYTTEKNTSEHEEVLHDAINYCEEYIKRMSAEPQLRDYFNSHHKRLTPSK